jgi:hypothetical protein
MQRHSSPVKKQGTIVVHVGVEKMANTAQTSAAHQITATATTTTARKGAMITAGAAAAAGAAGACHAVA